MSVDGEIAASVVVAPSAAFLREQGMGRRLTKPRDATMRFIARKGLFDAVAAQCGITPGAVRLWLKVPPTRVRDVERAIGRSRHLIRPDIYAE